MSITVNINKAKEIVKDKLRAERKPVLESLDVQFQRALETNADTSTIVAKKQELRDITKDASLVDATDVDELKDAMNNLIQQIKA